MVAEKKCINYMDIGEFRDKGYLQEINRQFLHPLGLALEISHEVDDETGEEGPWILGGIWDYRSDPEGMLFGDDYLGTEEAQKKAAFVDLERTTKALERHKRLGFDVQPLGG